MPINKEFLKNAYKLKEAENYFNSFNIESAKVFLLENYKYLDSVYSLLERADIVCVYSKFEILKDMILYENFGEVFIEYKNKELEQINFIEFAAEAYNVYKND